MLQIGHLIKDYPALTETFIRSFLQEAKKSNPLVLAETLLQDVTSFAPVVYLLHGHDRAKMSISERRYFLGQLKYPNCYENTVYENNIDVLHAHFGPLGFRALNLKQKTKRPLVTSFYGIDASAMIQRPEWPKRYKRLFEVGDAFVCLGQNMVKRLCAIGCPEGKIHVIHLGVDVDQISFRERSVSEHPVLLYCGRLVEKKGVLDALDAFAQVAKKRPQLTLRIIGDGVLRSQLRRRIRALGLQDRVHMLGALPQARVFDEMAQADLFILPSKTASNGDMEGTPTVLLEAQASGLPVLTTHHADIPEVVQDGVSGYLVDEADVESLQAKLDVLLAEPERWAEFGRAGRAHVVDRYHIAKETQKLESLYQSLI